MKLLGVVKINGKDSCNTDDSNTDVTTIINNNKEVFLVTVTNVTDSNFLLLDKYNINSCYTTVSNLSRILNLLTKEIYVFILYTLIKIGCGYLNLFMRIVRLDAVKISRAVTILEREGIIYSFKRNKDTQETTAHLSIHKTVSPYHLDKIIFYKLTKRYDKFLVELMFLWEKEFPDFLLKNVDNYKREIRTSRSKIENRIKINSKHEKSFFMETKKVLKRNPGYIDGRLKYYNNEFGANLTKEEFKLKLKSLELTKAVQK